MPQHADYGDTFSNRLSSTGIGIPAENIFDLREANVIRTRRPHYASMAAIKAHENQAVHINQRDQLIPFNLGHGLRLYEVGIVDESNFFKVIADNKKEDIRVVVSVGQILEMATWLSERKIPIPADYRGSTWYGYFAGILYQELGQNELKTQSAVVRIKLKPANVEKDLQDKRKTFGSVTKHALSLFHARKKINWQLIKAAKAFLEQLERLSEENPEIVDYRLDTKYIDLLRQQLERVQEDLKTDIPHIPHFS